MLPWSKSLRGQNVFVVAAIFYFVLVFVVGVVSASIGGTFVGVVGACKNLYSIGIALPLWIIAQCFLFIFPLLMISPYLVNEHYMNSYFVWRQELDPVVTKRCDFIGLKCWLIVFMFVQIAWSLLGSLILAECKENINLNLRIVGFMSNIASYMHCIFFGVLSAKGVFV